LARAGSTVFRVHSSDLRLTTGYNPGCVKKPYTDKQGQYLAFIYYYTKVNKRAPAEVDMERYFGVTPPSVHQMVLTLEANGLIERTPGVGRSIRLLIPREQLPDLV
jgi:DNA-binding MarR family transcriptional regulator